MRLSHVRFHSTVVLLLGLALCAGCADPTKGKPEAEVNEPVADSRGAASGVKYAIGGDSKIDFVGSKVTGSHDGGFAEFSGTITLVDNDPLQSSVEIVIQTDSLWSDDSRLTDHLKSPDFFEVEKFPTATFESTSIERDGEAYAITGNLDLHGVTKSIRFPATIELADGSVRAEAEFSIKRFDFGIVYPGRQDDLIRDDVLIRFSLVAEPESA